ncbi:MAG: alpha-glucan family phosphorylase [Pyrinomonadaceae bacterium]
MIETTDELTKQTVSKKLPLSLRQLDRLSWNYWWSWAPDGAATFRDLDPKVWEECEHNPRLLLARTSEYRLAQMATDPTYILRVRKLVERFDQYLIDAQARQDEWSRDPNTQFNADHPVAYFCAEYGLHNSLPLYSGGLGILAGDHLKSASDIGIPLVAVGLLYRYGYFTQRFRRDGWQEEHYGDTHPEELPLQQVKDDDGTPLTIEVLIRKRMVHALVWRAAVGQVQLYLLDTNIPENSEIDRLVTGHLYGGDRETRIVQEMLLGIGGIRLLRRLKLEPSVFHLNEGHSAFLTLELAREFINSQNINFNEAAKLVRELCVFTTHTPVAAGNDEFEPELVRQCFGSDYWKELQLSDAEFFDLGRVDPANDKENYGLTPLAIRMCRSTNGVSRKHGEVSRSLWQKLWPEKPLAEIPITYITNGVHAPTWVAPLLRTLYEEYAGKDWTAVAHDRTRWEASIARLSDQELWTAHSLLKQRLIAFIRERSFQARQERGESSEYTESARTMFDANALTIGFARRIAAYKRWSLLLTDPERLQGLMTDPDRPVQFVFAGKAHPQDQGAKLILQQLALWKYNSHVQNRAVFIQDYDQEIARQLVQSVDVWLNVPRRPLEASGTSGEKVAMNGGLNLSVLDGWWLEGYDGTNGFAVGGTSVDGAPELVDLADAESLYRVLEEEVIPTYYERDQSELPRKWIAMMKRSIVTLVPEFNSDRMVAEYARRIYK